MPKVRKRTLLGLCAALCFGSADSSLSDSVESDL
jgi:hypothetical protein